MSPFLEIAELQTGQANKFAIVRIDPTRQIEGGCEAICVSLHSTRGEAEAARKAIRGADHVE